MKQLKSRRTRNLLRILLYSAFCLLAGYLIEAAIASNPNFPQMHPWTVYDIPDFQGEAVFNLIHGHGLLIADSRITGPSNPLSYRAARMPLPIIILALLSRLVGTGLYNVELAKTFLSILPCVLAFIIIQRGSSKLNPRRLWLAFIVVTVFTLLPNTLSNLALVGAEEGFVSPLLALASAFLFFPEGWNSADGFLAILWAGIFGFTTAALYLCKSSMFLICLFLVFSFLRLSRRAAPSFVAIVIPTLAVVGWLSYTGLCTGKVALGTSLDQYNFYKGNNPSILNNYPPPPGTDLDPIYETFWWGHDFKDEWQFSDWNRHQAVSFIRGHLRDTLLVDLRKADVLLISPKKIGPDRESRGLITAGKLMSRLIARLALWSTLMLAIWQIAKGRLQKTRIPVIYLGFIACVCLPYILGFALTRHATILIFPTGVMLARQMLTIPGPSRSGHRVHKIHVNPPNVTVSTRL